MMDAQFDSPLRRSLDAIDAARRRAYATFAAGWVATAIAAFWFAHVLRTANDFKAALSAAVVALFFAIMMAAYAVMLYVARMTKRILRAIEIAGFSRDREA